ncbi:probable inactive serine threonine- kinase fnkC [Olea europaea subsp. europaea]|uniref:Probable inactive serine threonine- kinase fnkC n=1 Tax=Olea europaea subsp. europaea TaxID=158383 RepID=A0A8S0T1T1_OLEEU|nr:probable inactive serine threonine- kinase fnkC [Olea europaea subsp. europaea]
MMEHKQSPVSFDQSNLMDNLPSIGDDNEVTLETRNFSPAHLLFKIESFSLLSENGIDKIESSEFESNDNYKWKLIIYPNGRNTVDGANHVSAYLAVENVSNLEAGWEFNAVVSIFLFNHKLDKYVFKKGQRRFHIINLEWGFSKFIKKETLMDPRNGYLVNDTCVFGAEVFVVKNKRIRECLSILKATNSYKHELEVSKFSELENEWYSEEFNAGDHKWKVSVYPKAKGNGAQPGIQASIFLHKVGFSSGKKIKAHFSICMKNKYGKASSKRLANHWFSASSSSYGWPSCILVADIIDPYKGFSVEDHCIIEVEISIQAVLRGLP